MHPLLTRTLAVAALGLPLASVAATLCPETIKVQQTGSSPVADWSVSYSKDPPQLEMVSFYKGSPKQDAPLMYDTLTNAMDGTTATWKLPKEARGYWVKCSYRGTTLELSKELPRTVSFCAVSYNSRNAELGVGQAHVKEVTCK